jgi:hypothetical protein
MLIATTSEDATTHDGVNVTVEGAVHLDGQDLVSPTSCNSNLAGTFETKNGCFYFCDGTYWQSFNVAFNDSNPEGNKCEHMSRCFFDGVYLRPGDQVTAYPGMNTAGCYIFLKMKKI